jgi:hypothetical protein
LLPSGLFAACEDFAAAILAAVEGGILPPGWGGPGFRLLPGFSLRPQLRQPLSAGQDTLALTAGEDARRYKAGQPLGMDGTPGRREGVRRSLRPFFLRHRRRVATIPLANRQHSRRVMETIEAPVALLS